MNLMPKLYHGAFPKSGDGKCLLTMGQNEGCKSLGTLKMYSGSRPLSPSAAEIGILLATFEIIQPSSEGDAV